MVFVKFYTYYYTSIQAQVLNKADLRSLSEKSLSALIFGANEDLVDMKELAKYLISRVGNQQVIDPITKEDAIWNLIDFFTKNSDFYRVS